MSRNEILRNQRWRLGIIRHAEEDYKALPMIEEDVSKISRKGWPREITNISLLYYFKKREIQFNNQIKLRAY